MTMTEDRITGGQIILAAGRVTKAGGRTTAGLKIAVDVRMTAAEGRTGPGESRIILEEGRIDPRAGAGRSCRIYITGRKNAAGRLPDKP